jgi:addiction module RelE/StbE family toxin
VSQDKHAVRLLSVAEKDLNEIVTYIAVDNRRAAEAIATKIEKALFRLSDYPYLGRIPNEEELAQAGYRYLIVENYLVFYVVEEREIVVHRIIHGARDYRRLL